MMIKLVFVIGCACGVQGWSRDPSYNIAADAILLALNHQINAEGKDSFAIQDITGNFHKLGLNGDFTLKQGTVQGVGSLKRKSNATLFNVDKNGVKVYRIEAVFRELSIKYDTSEVTISRQNSSVRGTIGNFSVILEFRTVNSSEGIKYKLVNGWLRMGLGEIGVNITSEKGYAAKFIKIALDKDIKKKNSLIRTMVKKRLSSYLKMGITFPVSNAGLDVPSSLNSSRIANILDSVAVNNQADEILNAMNYKIKTEVGVLKLPNATRNYKASSRKIGFYTLSEGRVRGIASLVRVGNATLVASDGKKTFHIDARCAKLRIQYNGMLFYDSWHLKSVYGELKNHLLNIRLDSKLDDDGCKYVVHRVTFLAMDGMDVMINMGPEGHSMRNDIDKYIKKYWDFIMMKTNEVAISFRKLSFQTPGLC